MHVLEISAKLQNAEISPVTLLKGVSITDAHPAILKLLGTLTRNFCHEWNQFQYGYRWVD